MGKKIGHTPWYIIRTLDIDVENSRWTMAQNIPQMNHYFWAKKSRFEPNFQQI